MTNYSIVSIDIRLYTDNMDDDQVVYRQTMPLNVLAEINPNWLKQVIATVNKLEVPNV